MSSALRRTAAAMTAAGLASVATVGTGLASTASWSVVPSPNPSTPNYSLKDVTCASANDCWAVGNNFILNGQALIEHNAGSGWVIVTTPTLAGGGSLSRVTCVSATDCWAVGTVGYQTTLIEHYDGSSWTIVNSPNPGSPSRLWGLTCVNASSCLAVGDYYPNGTNAQALIEQYNGTSWVVVASNLGYAFFTDVSCLSVLDCWAVGASSYGSPYGPCAPSTTGCTVIEHNTGNGWVLVPSPNIGSDPVLRSVTCSSASGCWAVGEDVSTRRIVQVLTEHYDGSAWTVVATPHPSYGGLLDVSCVGTTDCWAVGYRNDRGSGGRVHHTLIEHHIAGGWVIVANPLDNAELDGITCVTARDCWAVGAHSAYPSQTTLVEQYS
jgi:hypothetical protein